MISGKRWASIPGFDRYQISGEGEVRQIAHTDSSGKPFSTRVVTRQTDEDQGLPFVTLLEGSDNSKVYIADLMAAAFFHERDPASYRVTYLDNQPGNVRLSNLRVTKSAVAA